MGKIIKCTFAIIASYCILYGVNSVSHFFHPLFALGICIGMEYLIYSIWQPRITIDKMERVECILNLRTNTTGDEFSLSKYRGYKRIRSEIEGNDYISPEGAVVCTKYVDKKRSISHKEFNISTHIICISIGFWSYILLLNCISENIMFEQAIVYFQDKIFSFIKDINMMWNNLYQRILNNTDSVTIKTSSDIVTNNCNMSIESIKMIIPIIVDNIRRIIYDIQTFLH